MEVGYQKRFVVLKHHKSKDCKINKGVKYYMYLCIISLNLNACVKRIKFTRWLNQSKYVVNIATLAKLSFCIIEITPN